MVTVEDSQGGLTEYCKKQDIEREILQNNKKKNKAIPPSPLYKKPLTQNFGFKWLTYFAKTVLAGAYEPGQDIPEAEANLLAALAYPEDINRMTT